MRSAVFDCMMRWRMFFVTFICQVEVARVGLVPALYFELDGWPPVLVGSRRGCRAGRAFWSDTVKVLF